MTKMVKTTEYEELLEDAKYCIRETLEDEWFLACQRHEFDYTEDHEAYGDTYVSTGSYITEKSEEDFRQRFEDDNDPNELIDKLKLNPTFCECLKSLVKEFVKNAEIE